jgi:uncharacterized membrane protein YkoI
MAQRCILVLLLLTGSLSAAAAADKSRCLTHKERIAAVATHHFVPLAKVLRHVKARVGGEVVRVRLCEREGRMVYRLTVLPHNGKVVLASVYADNGADADGS